jgi:hypothetical protein
LPTQDQVDIQVQSPIGENLHSGNQDDRKTTESRRHRDNIVKPGTRKPVTI